MKFKKLAAAFSAAVLAGTAVPISAMTMPAAAAGSYNYAEALQKSMFFYEVQQSGALPSWNNVPWRADSMVDESGKDTDKVPGGWYDAGDHYKFTLTNAYSASILAWGLIEYGDAVKKAGLDTLYKNNLKWGLDYVLNCDIGGGKMVGTIGDTDDHVVWCSAEVYLRKHHLKTGDWERPYDTITDSCTLALSAAALAEGYIIFQDENYLKHAKSLFASADATRSNKDQGTQKNFYPTTSWVDDCMYAACWLYKATGDESYLAKIESDYIPEFPLENQSTERKFTWGLCWDDTSQAAAFLYAQITEKQEWIDHVQHHLEYWGPNGYGGKKIDYTGDGLAWLFNWGCLRHATTTAWLAELAGDTLFKNDASLSKKYKSWAESQMNYCFGDNALKLSYVLGMGDKNPTAVHHRTASGIHDDHWNELGKSSGGNEGWQTEYAHTLYGALIGGPDKDGNYDMTKIGVSDYQYSEVAIDYNAGYTACLCALINDYGGTPLADFPPEEEPTWDEWEVAAVINGTAGTSYTEIKMWAMNHTAWPARVQKDIEVRYYFDLAELEGTAVSVDDVKVEGKSQQYSAGEQGYATVTGPHHYEGTVYYASIKFEDGRAIQPTGQSEHRDEVQFRISIPDAVDGQSTAGIWKTSNDPSYVGLEDATDLKKADSLNKNFVMFVNGAQVWGVQPDGTEGYSGADLGNAPSINPDPGTQNPPEETDEPTQTDAPEIDGEVLWGDVDCSGLVDIADAIKLAQYNAEKTSLTPAGVRNANIVAGDTIGAEELNKLLLYLADLISVAELAP